MALNANQKWLNDWAVGLEGMATELLSKKVFQEVLPHFNGGKVKYGPDKLGKNYVITISGSNVAHICIPIS